MCFVNSVKMNVYDVHRTLCVIKYVTNSSLLHPSKDVLTLFYLPLTANLFHIQ